jgi:transposase InsO family protein
VTVAARRELVRFGQARGLSERRALQMARLSGSVLRYERRADRNQALRARIVDMAHRHRRYGYRMIHLRLRHEGWTINLKRVRRLSRLENLMVRRRRRKKVALGERQPLVPPSRRNEVWSVDFDFDRLADGRSLKCLTVVDD